MTIIEAIEDNKLFGSLFKDQTSWRNWKIFIKSIFVLSMDKGERTIYKRYTERARVPKKQFREIYSIVGRRGGKSYISAIIACFLALFYDWRPFLSPGEQGWIMIIATDRTQARVIMGYIKAILQLKMFKNQIEKELTSEIWLKNQVIISIKTCDYRSIRGFTVLAAICDEIAFWRSEGVNPAEEILTALRPALATVPGSMLLGISTPYSRTGPLYENFRESYGKEDPDTLIWKAPTLAMNPTISKKIINKSLNVDRAAGKAEWLAEFRDDLAAFLSVELIDNAIISGRHELPRQDDIDGHAFTDPSGGRADSFTLGISFKDHENGKIILARLEERKPPFSPQDVVKEYAEILKSYDIYDVTGDRYSGEWVVKAFEEEEINYVTSDLNKSEIYLEFLPLMTQSQVELLDNDRLRNQLRGLERQCRSGAKDKVDHYPGGHDDISNSCAGACVLAAKDEYNDMNIEWI